MNSASPPSSAPIGLPPEQFAAAFPFHLALDRSMKLLQAGSTLRRICPDVEPGANLDQIFRVIRPEGRMTLEWVREHSLRFFLLEHLTTKLQLRGEFVILTGEETRLFLGSPWFTDSSEIAALGLGFEDFAIHDPVVDMLQVFQGSKQALADAKKLAAKLTQQRTQLRATASRLEALLRNLQTGVIVEDADRRLVLVNQRFCEIFQIPAPPEALVGMDCRSAAQQSKAFFSDPVQFVERIVSTLQERVAVLGEEWIMRDGRVFERDYVPILVESQYAGHLWAYREVTERHRAEEELRAEKDLLAVTLGSIVDGVITVDARQQVQLLNLAAEALTGWTSARAAGRPLADVFVLRDDRDAPASDLMTEAMTQGHPLGDIHSVEKLFTLRSCDERRRTIVISAIPMRDATGAIHGGLIVFRDVSSELEAEQMKQDFVHAVSHELRTPLTSIRGFIATIQDEPAMPGEIRREFLQIIHDQAERLGQLVDNILEISRIEAGNTLYEDEPLQLGVVAERSLAEIRPQAVNKPLRLEVSILPGLPVFNGDPMRLQSALTNLLANAVKFTPEGGLIRLELGVHHGEIRVAVRDSGLGIAEEHLDRIFQKFYRVPRPGLQIPGTGLGLSIVRAIVEHYGGRIEVESQVNQGSCFRIYLPLNPVRKPKPHC